MDFADILDALRLDVHHSQFRTGVFLLANPTNYQTAGIQFADIARRSISRLLPAAQRDIAARHGSLEQAEMAVIGMGKLGSGEMSLQSDLDLVIVFDSSDFAETSDGDKPLAGDVWMARAARRLISGLTVPTQEGSLYNVDMRLRPSGNAGPLVTKMSSFTTYQQNDAWTWEHMALTQASVIAGSPDLVARLNAVMADVICRQRDKSVLADDVEAMRQRLFEHQKSVGLWMSKMGPAVSSTSNSWSRDSFWRMRQIVPRLHHRAGWLPRWKNCTPPSWYRAAIMNCCSRREVITPLCGRFPAFVWSPTVMP